MTIIKKVKVLISPLFERDILKLVVLLFVGLLFELLGLGVIIPIMTVIVKSDITAQYPNLAPYLLALGNPSQTQLIILALSFLIIIYLLKTFFMIYLSWKQSRFSSDFSADLSFKLFNGYLRMPYSFHLRRNTADLIKNVQSEIGQFIGITQSFLSLVTELTFLMGILFLLITLEPYGAIGVCSFLALAAFFFHRATRNALLKLGESRQFYEGQSNRHLMQGLGAVKDIKLLGREENFMTSYYTERRNHLNIIAKLFTFQQMPRLYMELLAILGLAGIVILMLLQDKELTLILPTLAVFMAASFRILPSVNRIMSSMQMLRYAQPVIEVLSDEINLINNFSSTETSKQSLVFENYIEIEALTFRYENTTRSVLSDVSFKIKKGESIGFVGTSGSGKSTLLDVILGLLTPTDGKINVDGVDIQRSLRNWQDHIGYVPQSIYLTDDTIRNNIAFGISAEDLNDSNIDRVIKAAQLEEFIDSQPDGLNTIVGERGVRLSGGQRQRIGIARALYHDPEILVLDEATSALDSATELEVMKSITALHGNKSILIIAHRLSTVKSCDRIFRVKDGKVTIEEPTRIIN